MKIWPWVILPFVSFAQPAPTGTWNTHYSYFRALDITSSPHAIYCMTENGLFSYDLEYEELTRLERSVTGKNNFSSIAYDPFEEVLWVGFDDGMIARYSSNRTEQLDVIFDLDRDFDKEIRNFNFTEESIYACTSFGIVVFDRSTLLVRESYIDLGPESGSLGCNDVLLANDSVFVATDAGVFVAPVAGVNLQNPANYRRIDIPGLNLASQVTEINESIWVAGDQNAWRSSESGWIPVFGENKSVKQVTHQQDMLYIVANDSLFSLQQDVVELHLPGMWQQVNEFIPGQTGTAFVADEIGGLKKISSITETLRPTGPQIAYPTRLLFRDSSLFVLDGLWQRNQTFQTRPGRFDEWRDGRWMHYHAAYHDPAIIALPRIRNIVSIDFYRGQRIISSFGDGLFTGNTTFGGFENPSSGVDLFYSDILSDLDILYAIEYAAVQSFHVFEEDAWRSEAITPGNPGFPVALTGAASDLWIRFDGSFNSGLVYYDGNFTLLNDQTNTGNLPSNRTIDFDRDINGELWVATTDGLAYFFNISGAQNINAAVPVLDDRALLRDQQVTAIASDGGGRKWIGTRQGLWLVSASGDEIFEYFTPENSPLPSPLIVDIAFDPLSGDVFIATDRGLVSYRSNSLRGTPFHGDNMKVYPNPVPPGYQGELTIEGLAIDAIVKITDTYGNLMYETTSFGGRTSWNLRNDRGNRVGGGIYLIFSSTRDGEDHLIGKVAISN